MITIPYHTVSAFLWNTDIFPMSTPDQDGTSEVAPLKQSHRDEEMNIVRES